MSSVCRVCLAGGDVKLYPMEHVRLREVFEKLTDMKFDSIDGRPSSVCCFCYRRLLRCYTLSEMVRRSEKIFSELFLKGREATHETIEELNLDRAQHLSMGPKQFVALGDGTTEESALVIIREELISVKVERIEEEPWQTELIRPVKSEESINYVLSPEESEKSNDVFENSSETLTENSEDINDVYYCDVCKKKFHSRKRFVPHIRTHDLNKVYCCDMCSKKFNTRKRIVAHIKRHNPKRLNVCNICGKKLSSKGNLSRHMIVHTGQKPYKCDKCDRLFTQRCHLERHIAIFHTAHAKEKT